MFFFVFKDIKAHTSIFVYRIKMKLLKKKKGIKENENPIVDVSFEMLQKNFKF